MYNTNTVIAIAHDVDSGSVVQSKFLSSSACPSCQFRVAFYRNRLISYILTCTCLPLLRMSERVPTHNSEFGYACPRRWMAPIAAVPSTFTICQSGRLLVHVRHHALDIQLSSPHTTTMAYTPQHDVVSGEQYRYALTNFVCLGVDRIAAQPHSHPCV